MLVCMTSREPVAPTTATGFANVAQDYWTGLTDIADTIAPRPEVTHMTRAAADGLAHLGVFAGDLLIWEERTEWSPGCIVLVQTTDDVLLGEVRIREGVLWMCTVHGGVQPLPADARVLGVVTHTVRRHHPRGGEHPCQWGDEESPQL